MAQAAGVEEGINLNRSYDRGKLNVYVVRNEAEPVHRLKPGDARYIGNDVLLIGERVVWPILPIVTFAGVEVAPSDERSHAATLWFQFVLLHELGHRALHRAVISPSRLVQRTLEQEADDFAFERLGALVFSGSAFQSADDLLLSSLRIRALSDPDRTTAMIASLIQNFSVNLLYSDAVWQPVAAEIGDDVTRSPAWWSDEPVATPFGDLTDEEVIRQLGSMYYLGEAGVVSCYVERGAFRGGQTPIVFSCQQDYYTGYIDSGTKQLVDVQFHNGPERLKGDTVEIVDLVTDQERATYFFQSTLTDSLHIHQHEIKAWVAAGGSPRLAARETLATDWIPTGSILGDWLRTSHPATLACKQTPRSAVICVEFLDSIFYFDPQSTHFGVLFYPAGQSMSTDGQGRFAFFAPGAYRVFVSELPTFISAARVEGSRGRSDTLRGGDF